MALAAGTRLGPYEIRGLLGAGGMGEVYRAFDPRLGRAVAALNHPSIVTVHDVGTQDATPYVVMELLEGETLRELASRRTPTQRLPYDELMAKLRALTNLRVVEDAASPTGHKLDVGPFPGWKDVPKW
jgi:serine/threonine protein kinase